MHVQRRLRREAVRNVGYTKFLKKHTHKKNIAAREKDAKAESS